MEGGRQSGECDIDRRYYAFNLFCWLLDYFNVASVPTCARWPITITHSNDGNFSVTLYQAVQSIGGCACQAAKYRLTQCSSHIFSPFRADKQHVSLAPPGTANVVNSVLFGDTGLSGCFVVRDCQLAKQHHCVNLKFRSCHFLGLTFRTF
jgi:hypothetical protein